MKLFYHLSNYIPVGRGKWGRKRPSKQNQLPVKHEPISRLESPRDLHPHLRNPHYPLHPRRVDHPSIRRTPSP